MKAMEKMKRMPNNNGTAWTLRETTTARCDSRNGERRNLGFVFINSARNKIDDNFSLNREHALSILRLHLLPAFLHQTPTTVPFACHRLQRRLWSYWSGVFDRPVLIMVVNARRNETTRGDFNSEVGGWQPNYL